MFLIAGPCAIENRDITLTTAEALKRIAQDMHIELYFKSSFDKANRTSVNGIRGMGLNAGIQAFADIKSKLNIPCITDVHEPYQCPVAAQVIDILQIPAFLCRQTDLLVAAAKTGKVVNVKKGQFMSPEAMRFAVEKVRAAGNEQVLITERGTTFGYTDLVVDFRGVKELKRNACPVVFDATHSLQQPNQAKGVTGGRPDLIETMAKAAVAVGFDGLFMETHPEPAKALSDGANMLPLNQLHDLLVKLVRIRKAI